MGQQPISSQNSLMGMDISNPRPPVRKTTIPCMTTVPRKSFSYKGMGREMHFKPQLCCFKIWSGEDNQLECASPSFVGIGLDSSSSSRNLSSTFSNPWI